MKTFALTKPRTGKSAALLACVLGTFAAAHAQPLLITTVAGYAGKGSTDGTGSGALFYNPQGVAVDAAGNVYVADSGNNTIRMISRAAVVTTVAGLGGMAGSADGTGSSVSLVEAMIVKPSSLDSSLETSICVRGVS